MLIVLPFWMNGLVRVFSWTMVLREGGVLDYALHLAAPGPPPLSLLYSFPAIITIGLVHGYLPYMYLTCYLSVLSVEDAYIEAARSLGARTPMIFWKIILPLSLPGLISGAILIFVFVIGSFMEPRILGGRVGVTMGTVIEDQFVQAFNWPLGAALSFTMLAVVLIICRDVAAAVRPVRRTGGAVMIALGRAACWRRSSSSSLAIAAMVAMAFNDFGFVHAANRAVAALVRGPGEQRPAALRDSQ